MSENKNGGPAFPMGYHRDGNGADHRGMSLRDYFAAKAMQATLVNANPLTRSGDSQKSDLALRMCAAAFYRMADAMLKAREQ